MAWTSNRRVDFNLYLAINNSTINGLIEEHPHRLIGNEKCFSCSTTVFRFYPQRCCKLFCGAAQLMGVLFKWPVLQYCSAAEMCWVQIFFSTCSFGTNANNCHHFIIVFSENEHCDAKMSIPTNLNITITVYNYYYCFFSCVVALMFWC